MTQDNFWSLIQTVLEHDKDEDHHPVEIVNEDALTAVLLTMPPKEIAAFEEIFRDFSVLAHRRISEVRQDGENDCEEADWNIDSLIGWTMIHGQAAFMQCLADPATTVREFDHEITEIFHEGADLQGLAPRAYLLKTGQPMPGCEFDRAEQDGGLNLLAFNDPQRLADVLPSLRAVTESAEKLRGDGEAALEKLEAARRGLQKGGTGVGLYLLSDDIAATRGLLHLLSSVKLLMPQSLLRWSDSL